MGRRPAHGAGRAADFVPATDGRFQLGRRHLRPAPSARHPLQRRMIPMIQPGPRHAPAQPGASRFVLHCLRCPIWSPGTVGCVAVAHLCSQHQGRVPCPPGRAHLIGDGVSSVIRRSAAELIISRSMLVSQAFSSSARRAILSSVITELPLAHPLRARQANRAAANQVLRLSTKTRQLQTAIPPATAVRVAIANQPAIKLTMSCLQLR